MYLTVDETNWDLATVWLDATRFARYERKGLSSKNPDGRFAPGRTDLEPYLRTATEFPDEISLEFVHENKVYRYVRLATVTAVY